MTRLKRGTYAPEAGFRHPVTGVLVRHSDGLDPELLCMRERLRAGETGGVLDHVVRVQELAHQSAQNRQRIVRRTLGTVEHAETLVDMLEGSPVAVVVVSAGVELAGALRAFNEGQRAA